MPKEDIYGFVRDSFQYSHNLFDIIKNIYIFYGGLNHFDGFLKETIRPRLDFNANLTRLVVLCAIWY